MRGMLAIVILVALAAPAPPARAIDRNGFHLDSASVPVEEIRPGGPPRDAIPALDSPPTEKASATSWGDDTLVLGVALGGEARAYPVAILNWHELVNDRLGGREILVSYCPLCGTGLVFDRDLEGGVRHFGVSGLLYRSDVLFYDRESESLWSQIEARALTGRARGTRLHLLRSQMTRLALWRQAHPETLVLARDTGYERDYSRNPYGSYSTSTSVMLHTKPDPRYHPKMPTLGVRTTSGRARAYPAVEVARAGGKVEERFAGRRVSVAYDPEAQLFHVEADPELEVVEGYWFAWAAFHPQSEVFTAPATP
ncbi:MAG: DUF3179 domain-containing protein [Myxococcota bacterium]